MSFQVGFVIIGCILLALLFSFKLSNSQKSFLGINLMFGILGLFLCTAGSAKVYESISPLAYIQFPWRFLSPVTLFCAAAGGAIGALCGKPRSGYVLILVLLGSTLWFSSEQRTLQAVALSPQDIKELAGDLGPLCVANEYLPANVSQRILSVKSGDRPYSPTGKFAALDTGHKKMEFSFVGFQATNKVVVPWFYFPGWNVLVDGKPVEVRPSEDGLVTFSSPEGLHQVAVAYGTTTVRVIGWTVSLFTLTVIALFSLKTCLSRKIRE
jgi:hypothetical protein